METTRARLPRRFLLPVAVTACVAAALLVAARPLPAPAATTSQDARGKVLSITSESTPFGMSLFRLWSNGDIEVMVLGQDNVWTDWKGVAPGKSGMAPGTKQSD